MTDHEDHKSESTLVGPFDQVQHSRPRHRPIPWADPAPTDHYATHLKGKCQDSAGVHRTEHWYGMFTRQGWRCVYCRELRRMDPI